MKASGKIWIFFDQAKARQTKPMSATQAQLLVLSLQHRDLSRYTIWTPGWDQWISLAEFLESDQNIFVVAPKPIVNLKITNREETAPDHTNDDRTVVVDDFTVKTDSKRNDANFDFLADSNSEDESQENSNSDSNKTEEPSFTSVSLEPVGQAQDYGYYFQDFNGDDLELTNGPRMPKSKKSLSLKKPSLSYDSNSKDRRAGNRHAFKIEIIIISANGKSFRSHSRNISLNGTLLEEDLPKEFRNGNLDLVIVNKFDSNRVTARLHFQGCLVSDLKDYRRIRFLDSAPEMIGRLDALLKSYLSHKNQLKKKTA